VLPASRTYGFVALPSLTERRRVSLRCACRIAARGSRPVWCRISSAKRRWTPPRARLPCGSGDRSLGALRGIWIVRHRQAGPTGLVCAALCPGLCPPRSKPVTQIQRKPTSKFVFARAEPPGNCLIPRRFGLLLPLQAASTENPGVGGSIPSLPTIFSRCASGSRLGRLAVSFPLTRRQSSMPRTSRSTSGSRNSLKISGVRICLDRVRTGIGILVSANPTARCRRVSSTFLPAPFRSRGSRTIRGAELHDRGRLGWRDVLARLVPVSLRLVWLDGMRCAAWAAASAGPFRGTVFPR
jgi:hypothetical protein